jgi:hypothetical protein
MTEVIISHPLSAEARFQSNAGQCGNCGGQSSTGTGFSPSTSIFLVSIVSLVLRAHSVTCHRRCIVSAFNSVVKKHT